MRVMLEYGLCAYQLIDLDSEGSVLFQSDCDFPNLARHLGMQSCCGDTDGTVDCSHKTATEHIEEAMEWLDEHCGMVFENDDYNSLMEATQ